MRKFLVLFCTLFVLFGINASAVDSVNIDKFDVRFRSGASLKDGKYVWSPEDSNSGHMFAYRMSYGISGTFSGEKGSLRFEFPAHILKSRDGKYADEFDCPYRLASEVGENERVDFVYEIQGDKAVVYNWRPYTEGHAGYIEFGYVTTKQTYDYVDMTASDGITARMQVTNGDTIAESEATAPCVYVDTHCSMRSVSKAKPDRLYTTWQDGWGARPADADDWVYLVWCVNTYVEQGTSKYILCLQDDFDDYGGEAFMYSFGNSRNFTDNPFSDELTTWGNRYDYVLTRHSKAEHERMKADDSTTRYEVGGVADVKQMPVDGIDPATTKSAYRSWWIEFPVYVNPNGHFWADQWGIYHDFNVWVRTSDDISDYMLNEFVDGDVGTIDNLKFYIYTDGYPYPWTLGPGADGSVNDALNGLYGKKDVDWSLTTDKFYLENEALTDDDYGITSLSWNSSIMDADFDEETYRFQGKSVAEYSDDDVLDFYVRQQGSEEYVLACRYSWKDKAYFDVDTNIVSEATGSNVKFSTPVSALKYEWSNAYYYSSLDTYPVVSLNRNEHTLGLVGEEVKVRLKAGSTGQVSQDGKQIFSRDVEATDYIRRSELRSELKKIVARTRNDKVRQSANITWRVTFKEDLIANEITGVPQSSGVFYDLLPLACNLDTSSIEVYADGALLSPADYEVERVDNYNNTGRTLLTIRVNQSTEWTYMVYYDTTYLWESIRDYGRDLLNSVCYETGNTRLPQGVLNDGGDITEAELMAGLGSRPDEEVYIYAETRYLLETLMSGHTGLMKQVRNQDEVKWDYDTIVHQDGSYAYQIRMQNDIETESKDIIFFDSIESFYQKPGNAPAKESGWHGALESIDLAQLREKGVKPVVYLSDKALNPNDAHDVSDGGVWVEYSKFIEEHGLDKARSIAVDCRKSDSGRDFLLGKDESLVFVLYMKVPNTITDVSKPKAYNNIYVSRSAKSELDTEFESQFLHQDYTQVEWRACRDVEFRKVSAVDNGVAIPGTVWTLRGKSDYGTDYNLEAGSAGDGMVRFQSVESGTYELTEKSCGADWLLNQATYTVTVGFQGVEITGEGLSVLDGTYAIANAPRIHVDMQFSKVDVITGQVLSGGTFMLVGTSDYGTDVMQYARWRNAGFVENISGAESDIHDTDMAEERVKYDSGETADDSSGKSRLQISSGTNSVYARIAELRQELRDIDMRVEELEVKRANGTNTDADIAAIDAELLPLLEERMRVDRELDELLSQLPQAGFYFTDVEKGTYRLVELNAPDGYQADDLNWDVTVDGSGLVTVTHGGEPVELNGQGEFVLTNERWHSFYFHKKSSYGTDVYLEGAVYSLTGISDRGNAISRNARSDENGRVLFQRLESGTYDLVEVRAPDKHDLDATVYTVVVNADDSFEIKGLSAARPGFYEVVDRKTKGVVRVVKKWRDDQLSEDRVVPDISLSTLNPEGERLVSVKFEGDSGVELSSFTVAKKSVSSDLYLGADPIRPDDDSGVRYVFDGWDGPFETSPDVFVFRPKWQRVYTVVYDDGVPGDTVFPTQAYEGFKEGDVTPSFVGDSDCRPGYVFRGWSPAVHDVVRGDDADEYGVIRYIAIWEALVSVSLSPSDRILDLGDSFSCNIVVSNPGDMAIGCDIEFVLCDGLSYVSCGDSGKYDSSIRQVCWKNIYVGAHGSKSIRVDLRTNLAGDLRFEALVHYQFIDSTEVVHMSTNTSVSVEPSDPL